MDSPYPYALQAVVLDRIPSPHQVRNPTSPSLPFLVHFTNPKAKWQP